jgi:P2 family phage contractile tail tube protein
MVNSIPEKVVNYNVYQEGEKLVGVSGEVTLPNLEAMTETVSGAGIAGEFESATPGHFSSTQIEVPFRTILDPAFNLFTPGAKTLILRASQQSFDVSAGAVNHRALKIILKVMPKSLDLGTLGVGKPTETKNTLEVLYIKIVEDGYTLLELDKLNFIYIVNGTDVFADIRDQI